MFLVIVRLTAVSLCAMTASFFATEAWFNYQKKSHPASVVASTQSTQANAPADMTVAPDPPVEEPGEADLLNPNAPIEVHHYRKDEVPFMIISGGTAGTRRTPIRAAVEDIVQEAGARAGLNGTFFANASLRGTDNLLIGPSICGNESAPTFSPFDKHKELTGRPLVLISLNQTKIVPYSADTDDDETGLRSELPGMTDAFLGGVWLVHHGVPVTEDTIGKFGVKDAEDPRRRAFFALTQDGRPCLGATTYVATSTQLAQAVADAGFREAVLLDSGFSTSLVEDGKILVTGHTAPGIPSRPVPHAIVLFDTNPDDVRLARAHSVPMPTRRPSGA